MGRLNNKFTFHSPLTIKNKNESVNEWLRNKPENNFTDHIKVV